MARRTFRRTGYPPEGDADTISVDTGETNHDNREDTRIVVEENRDNRDDTRESEETVTFRAVEPGDLRNEAPLGYTAAGKPRKRRAKGTGTTAVTKQKTFQESNLEKLLLSLHLMGATFLRTPELAIDEKEAQMLSKATLDVFAAYGVPEMSDKTLAGIQLAGAMIAVYGTRAVAIIRKPKRILPSPIQQPIQPQGNVYQDAAQKTQQTAQQATTQPVMIKPNGAAYVQSPMSPFGDADGTETPR